MFTFEKTVAYHETDKMGITHHSNHIKWMEEARVAFFEHIGLHYDKIEQMGIASPVTNVSVDYKCPSTFGDKVSISVSVSKYTGVKLELCYTMRNTVTDALIATAFSSHCFLKNNKILALQKSEPKMHSVFESLVGTK